MDGNITSDQFEKFTDETRRHREKIDGDVERLKDSIDRWRVQVVAKQQKHDETLYGNGKPGLDEQIRSIEASLSFLIRLAWLVVGAVVSLSVGGIGFGIVYIIRASAP